MELAFEIDHSGEGQTTLIVSGEIDAASAPEFQDKIGDLLINGARQLIVDLDGVEFIDSTGLGVLVAARKNTSALDGDLKLICSRPRILKVFEITGLDEVFTFVDPGPRANESIPRH
jgi:anti-sigma B factor antagonist